MTGKAQQIVLFLVEGVTDKISLEAIIPHFIETDEVGFHITAGDLLTNEYATTRNIITLINENVKAYMRKNGFQKGDLLHIVHLIDTDGAFVSAENVYYADCTDIVYLSNRIETRNLEHIIARNKQKTMITNKLIETSSINKIPYSIGFFSCNLEHVLHNRREHLSSAQKMNLAEGFAERYSDDPDGFIRLIMDPQIMVAGDYLTTWSFIKDGVNSLNRYSNLHLFIF